MKTTKTPDSTPKTQTVDRSVEDALYGVMRALALARQAALADTAPMRLDEEAREWAAVALDEYLAEGQRTITAVVAAIPRDALRMKLGAAAAEVAK